MMKKRLIARAWPWQIALATVVALPLVGASCTTTASRIFRASSEQAGLLKSAPFGLHELNAWAKQIDQEGNGGILERNTPWRRGVAYEAVSQSMSFLRHVARQFGWDQSAIKQRVLNWVSLEPSEAELSVEEISTKYNLAFASPQQKADYERIMGDLLSIKQTGPLSELQRLNAVLAAGDDLIDSKSLDLAAGFNVDFSKVNFSDSFYKTIAEKSRPANALLTDAHPWKVTFYKDPSIAAPAGQGIMNIRVYGTPYSRNFLVGNLSPQYPILSSAIIDNDFQQALPLLITKLVGFYRNFIESFTDQFLPSDFVDILRYFDDLLSGKIMSAQELARTWTKVLNGVNTGAHHLLAVLTFYRGFSSEFVTGSYQIYNGTASTFAWKSGDLVGLEQISTTTQLLNYFAWPAVNVGPGSSDTTKALFYQGNPLVKGRLAYYAFEDATLSLNELLAKNLIDLSNKQTGLEG